VGQPSGATPESRRAQLADALEIMGMHEPNDTGDGCVRCARVGLVDNGWPCGPYERAREIRDQRARDLRRP
jgi:hypothetical protein